MGEKTYLDKAVEWANDHPITIGAGLCAFGTFGCYKLTQKLIADAIYKANTKTIKYILKMAKR